MSFPGGQRSIQKLVEEHYSSLYRYAFRLTGSRTDAEDLTQDTFCQAQAKFHQLRDPNRARSWLFSILRNAYLHRVRASHGETYVPLEWAGDIPDRLPEPLPEVDDEKLQQALTELPELFRTPIILYYFEEFSYRDIAEQMELPIGTVMSRLARAKAYLRERLFPSAAEPLAESGRRARDGL